MGILHIETLNHVSTDRKVVGTALIVNTRQLGLTIASQIVPDLNTQYSLYLCI